MRILSIIIAFIIFSADTSAQKPSSIVGHWKVISVFTGEVFVSSKTDSIFLSDAIKELYPNPEYCKGYLDMARKVFLTDVYFGPDGIYKHMMGDTVGYEQYYKINTLKSVIEVTGKNSLGNDVMEEIEYLITDEVLHLKIKTTDFPIELTLEKRASLN